MVLCQPVDIYHIVTYFRRLVAIKLKLKCPADSDSAGKNKLPNVNECQNDIFIQNLGQKVLFL